ncbi:hypothetical protein PISMIDRAFT_13178 [Pisolithus microcarpus 441]|uniref:Uncharacterized protein n=1 Tax=Pisolithus microcarpus 441 TaxID=765257 RepID=A0A0C9YU08_9AGAM|nr:hypothetical protein PISMIDRAFT_13178 [Pisolithus microcarpus 441]
MLSSSKVVSVTDSKALSTLHLSLGLGLDLSPGFPWIPTLGLLYPAPYPPSFMATPPTSPQ